MERGNALATSTPVTAEHSPLPSKIRQQEKKKKPPLFTLRTLRTGMERPALATDHSNFHGHLNHSSIRLGRRRKKPRQLDFVRDRINTNFAPPQDYSAAVPRTRDRPDPSVALASASWANEGRQTQNSILQYPGIGTSMSEGLRGLRNHSADKTVEWAPESIPGRLPNLLCNQTVGPKPQSCFRWATPSVSSESHRDAHTTVAVVVVEMGVERYRAVDEQTPSEPSTRHYLLASSICSFFGPYSHRSPLPGRESGKGFGPWGCR